MTDGFHCQCGYEFKRFMLPTDEIPHEVECPICGKKYDVIRAVSEDGEENYEFE